MPRSARIAFENSFYHVFNRGIGKQKIFFNDRDYNFFLKRLQELKTKKQFDHSIYAYVLMPNHFHFLIQVRKSPLAKILASLMTSYSMYINRTYKRVGPLFQNRFKSKLVRQDNYFLAGSRYIFLNPIEAKLVKNLRAYPWSGYQELFGSSNYSIIDKEEVTRLIGETSQDKLQYHKFLEEGIEKLNESKVNFGFDKDIDGDPRFITLSQKKYLRRHPYKTI